jgi:hypothetical protein
MSKILEHMEWPMEDSEGVDVPFGGTDVPSESYHISEHARLEGTFAMGCLGRIIPKALIGGPNKGYVRIEVRTPQANVVEGALDRWYYDLPVDRFPDSATITKVVVDVFEGEASWVYVETLIGIN